MTAPRYYFDTEFLDDGDNQRIVLISIALVCDDGRELYLVSNEFDYDEVKRDDWMRENVLKQLPPTLDMTVSSFPYPPSPLWRTREQIRDAIIEFVKDPGNDEKVEFWAFFASYDWVLFAQLFGKMINMPKHFPWLVNDLKTWAKHTGFTGKFKELLPNTGHHDALCDARWNRDVHKILLERQPLAALADALVDATEGAHEATPLATVLHLGSELIRDYVSTKGQLRDIEQRKGSDPIIDEILSRTKEVEIV
jgi:hypothetical protein